MSAASVSAVFSVLFYEVLIMNVREDGTIMLHDFRVGNGARPQGVMFGSSEFTGASYNPTMPNLFITGELKGHVRLRDVRMSFDRSNRRGGATVQTVSSISFLIFFLSVVDSQSC